MREGRRGEFQAFQWQGEPPDPQSPQTFFQSKLRWEKKTEGNHKVLRELYRRLIQLRRETPALANLDENSLEVSGKEEQRLIFLRRWYNKSQVFCALSFNKQDMVFRLSLPKGRWKKILDSSEKIWRGRGSLMPKRLEQEGELTIRPLSFGLYEKEGSS